MRTQLGTRVLPLQIMRRQEEIETSEGILFTAQIVGNGAIYTNGDELVLSQMLKMSFISLETIIINDVGNIFKDFYCMPFY